MGADLNLKEMKNCDWLDTNLLSLMILYFRICTFCRVSFVTPFFTSFLPVSTFGGIDRVTAQIQIMSGVMSFRLFSSRS